jgi:hypothetical protein
MGKLKENTLFTSKSTKKIHFEDKHTPHSICQSKVSEKRTFFTLLCVSRRFFRFQTGKFVSLFAENPHQSESVIGSRSTYMCAIFGRMRHGLEQRDINKNTAF